MMNVKTSRTVFKRLGRAHYGCDRQSAYGSTGRICKFWLAGNCTKNPCRFLHSATSATTNHGCNTWNRNHSSPKQSRSSERKKNQSSPVTSVEECHPMKERQKADNKIAIQTRCYSSESKKDADHDASGLSISGRSHEDVSKWICRYWINGNCVHGAKCKYVHSWYCGDGFSMLAQLQGHNKAVTGIVLPSGYDKLFSGSKDGTVRIWNCHTGKCEDIIDMGAEVGCLYSEGPWVFVGLANAVKALNIQTHANLSLSGPVGIVYAVRVGCDTLLAGAHDGAISAWKFNYETSSFEPRASLKGHSCAVVSLVVGAHLLYSGSMDSTIRTWDLNAMQCMQTLSGHSDVVMSLLFWGSFLLSCSLDGKLKIWTTAEGRTLDECYTHEEEHGILAVHGMQDAEGKPVIVCSCNDNSARLYELPSLKEKGRIFAKREIRTVHASPGGLFFSGDGTGQISVWKMEERSGSASN